MSARGGYIRRPGAQAQPGIGIPDDVDEAELIVRARGAAREAARIADETPVDWSRFRRQAERVAALVAEADRCSEGA